MNLLFILLLSCINVNMSGKLKHDVDVDVKIRVVDDTGDSGGLLEPKQIFK
jgi:hypothetical protein